MADLKTAKSDPKKLLWDELDKAHDAMLGIPSAGMHLQPMAPMASREENRVWFFTSSDSELAKAAAGGGKAMLCLVSGDHDYHACLNGTLVVNKSQQHVDRYWSSVVAAWFDGGKDDPRMTMLEFTPEDAAVWASSDSSLRFGWEIAKANLTDAEPHVGVSDRFTM